MINPLPWKSMSIVAVMAFLAGSAAGGWGAYQLDQARVLKVERDADKRAGEAEKKTDALRDAYNKRDAEARDAVQARQEADRKAVDAVAAASAAEARLRQITFNQIFKENRHVQEAVVAAGRPVYFVSVGWLRQYNAALTAPGSQAGDGAGAPAPPSGGADAASTGVSEWDVLDHHTLNARKWADCRRQVRDLLDILENTD